MLLIIAALTLNLTQAGKPIDATTLRLRDGAQEDYEWQRDALKMFGDASGVTTVASSGEWLALNTVGRQVHDLIVPVGFGGAAGDCAFAFDTEAFPADVDVQLVDYALGVYTDVRSAAGYAFEHAGGWGSERFALVFSDQVTTDLDDTGQARLLHAYPNPAAGAVSVLLAGPWSAEVPLRVIDVLGRTVHEATVREGQLRLDLDLPGGVYYLQAEDGGHTTRQRLVVE